jgi:hypothetical protein
MPELRISSDKVCDFIEMAREVAGLVPPTTGDRTTTGDDSRLVTIEDRPGDSRRGQMREFIMGLNGAEQTDLLALILVGRGDYDVSEWHDAVHEAATVIADRSPDYMIGDAALPEYLGAGLDAFDKSCD